MRCRALPVAPAHERVEATSISGSAHCLRVVLSHPSLLLPTDRMVSFTRTLQFEIDRQRHRESSHAVPVDSVHHYSAQPIMAPRRDANQPAQPSAASASASATASASGAPYSRLDKKAPRAHRSWARTLCVWGCILPLVTIALLIALPLLYKFSGATHTRTARGCRPSPTARGLVPCSPTLSLHICLHCARSCRMKTLQPGQPFSIISNQTFVAQPANVHSRFR